MSSELDSLRNQFFSELGGTCEDLEQDLMRLEQNPEDTATHKQILREIHTIKGNAGLVGEQQLQTLCHALETTLDRLYLDRRQDLATEYGLRAVDLMREAVSSTDVTALRARFNDFVRDLDPDPSQTTSVAEDRSAARPNAVGPTLSLDEWKRVMRAFQPVDEGVRALADGHAERRTIRKMGVATVDLVERIPPQLERLHTLATLIELTVGGVAGLPREGAEQAVSGFVPLLEFVTSRMRERLTELFFQNSFSVTVSVTNLAMLQALEQELRRREQSPILILRFDVDYDTLERDWSVYDSFWSLASMPDHTVAFLLRWSSAVEKAATFLEQAIGTAPLISHDEWVTLSQIAHHN